MENGNPNVYVSILTNKQLEKSVELKLKHHYFWLNHCFLTINADFIIADDWQRFGGNKPGIFVGPASLMISSLARKSNVAFMDLNNGFVYALHPTPSVPEIFDAEEIVASTLVGTVTRRIEKMLLNVFLTEWASLPVKKSA